MIKLFISQLEKQPLELSGKLDEKFLELGEHPLFEFDGPFDYRIHAQLISGGVLINGETSAHIKTTCGRCLEDFERDIASGKFKRMFPNEDIEKGEIILDDTIREEMLLAIPINFICREDCLGLCYNCGTNLNEHECKCKPIEHADDDNPWKQLDEL